MDYTCMVFGANDRECLQDQIGRLYLLNCVRDVEDGVKQLSEQQYKLIIINQIVLGMAESIELCRRLRDSDFAQDTPIVMLADREELADCMEAFDAGFDDLIGADAMWELVARIDRVMINRLANNQLKVQLQHANEMAFIAMSDTSDLGVNIQFLLDCNQCNNIDELGMRLFQAVQSYGISCSLQIRSEYGVKNMEANGMAKVMESVLLSECKDQGRYVDFGHRSIMNYETVSLLIKNMPQNDEKKYGAIKDNVFSLLQGAHARVVALDNLRNLELEGALVKCMAARMQEMMTQVDNSYHNVMRDIANVVENMADSVEHSIQFLGLDEHQEKGLQKIIEGGIADTSQIFNAGMHLDKGLKDFLSQVAELFNSGHISAAQLQTLIDGISSRH